MGLMDTIPKALDPLPGGDHLVNGIDYIVNWARANSLWPLTFGTSCCAIEMMAASMARYDISRFGAEVFRASPRQADLFIVAGTIVEKMREPLIRLYEQMPGPKYVIAMGACTVSGGPFVYGSYTTIRGIDQIIPVDVYIPGCPPRPEALLNGIMELQAKIKESSIREGWQARKVSPRKLENKWQNAKEAWDELEKIKNEEQAEARAKFKEENPDYKSDYKAIRIPTPKFEDIKAKIRPEVGISSVELFKIIKDKFPEIKLKDIETSDRDEMIAEIEKQVEAKGALFVLDFEIAKNQYFAFVNFIKRQAKLDLNLLFELTAIDWKEYFDVVVHLQSIEQGHRIHIRTKVEKEFTDGKSYDPDAKNQTYTASIDSITSIYLTANFHEREVYDLMGIDFNNHPDMRRIFLEDEFPGHPLRKDWENNERNVERPY